MLKRLNQRANGVTTAGLASRLGLAKPVWVMS
jgi:hypothetical protein